MCIYKERSAIYVSCTPASVNMVMLRVKSTSGCFSDALDLDSHGIKCRSEEYFNLCLFLGGKGRIYLCVTLSG